MVRVIERKVIIRIVGPVSEGDQWRNRSNMKVAKFINSKRHSVLNQMSKTFMVGSCQNNWISVESKEYLFLKKCEL